MSEVLEFLMAVGLHSVYRRPSSLVQKLVFDKGSLWLFSLLVYAQNQKNSLYPIIDALDTASRLQLRAQLYLHIEAILVWIYSTWVNTSGVMHLLDENSAVNREPTQLPCFLFPSQVATLMLVETEDLTPSDRPDSLAILRRSHGPEIPHANSASGREYPNSVHSPLRKNERNPAGSYLSNSGQQLYVSTAPHGL